MSDPSFPRSPSLPNAVEREAFFDRFEALTFDDVVIVPGYSEVLPDSVDTAATFARDITLAIPLVSAAMDKVTEAHMAVAMAREGGIGVIHRNLSIADQAAEVQKVKRSQSGMITDPVTLPVTATLHDAEALMNRFKFSGVPITADNGRLMGILTNRDIRFCSGADFDRPVSEFMSHERLITAAVGTSLDEARSTLQKYRIEKLPLVDADGILRGLITVKDILKRQEFPNGTRDSRGRLACAAALGVGPDVEERAEALAAMGVDALVIDTAHGHSAGVIKTIERLRAGWPEIAIVAGNVVTEDGVDALANAGADAIKVGVGAGSICTTRVVSGAGMPQLSAIHFTCARARRLGIPVIADGGITYSGDVVKAIAAGAETIMLGSSARRYRGSTGRTGTVRGSPLQELPRHGLARCNAGSRRRSLRQRAGPVRHPQVGARGHRRSGALRRHPRRCHLPAGRRAAQRHGIRRSRNARGAAQRSQVHEGDRCREGGVAPSRRDHHQRGTELPAQLVRTQRVGGEHQLSRELCRFEP